MQKNNIQNTIGTDRRQLIESEQNSVNRLFSPQTSQRQVLNQTSELSNISGNQNQSYYNNSSHNNQNQDSKSPNVSYYMQNYKNAQVLNSANQRTFNEKEELFFLAKEMTSKMKKVQKLERLKNIQHQFGNILKNTESRRKQQLNKQQLSRINDKAIVIKFKQIFTSFGQRLSHYQISLDEKISNLICCQKVFHPYNTFNLVSNIIENIMIIMSLFLYTLFCFFDFFEEKFFFYVVIASLIVFSSGTFLRINTGYFDQGTIIFDRKKIIYKYRTEIMMYDLVAFVGQIYQLFQNDNHQVTKILCFLLITKYKVYLYNLNKIEERMNLNGNMVYFWQLIKLVSTTLALCHFVGTAFFWIAVMEKFYLDQYSWVEAQGFWDEPIRYQYIQSFYSGLAIITLIGVDAVTELETVFNICSLVYTVGIFATILSTISTIYQEMDAKIKDYKKDRDTLNSFFEIHKLSNDIQGQLQNYLKYNFQGCKEMNVSNQFDDLMSRLPSNLQDLVRKERYSGYVQKMELFAKNFSDQVIQQLIMYVKEEYYMPNQVILDKDDNYYETKICFILQGEVESYYECQKGKKQSYKQPIKIYKQGEHFGHDPFFSNRQQFYSYKSKEGQFVTCLTINQVDFLNIINQVGYSKDLQRYYEIRDRLKFSLENNFMEEPCTLCNSAEHIDQNCNIVFYQVNKQRLYAKLNYSEANQRNTNFNRKNANSRWNNLQNLFRIFQDQQRIINDPDNRQYIKVIQGYQKEIENDYDLQVFDVYSSDSSSLDSNDDDMQSMNSKKDFDKSMNKQQQKLAKKLKQQRSGSIQSNNNYFLAQQGQHQYKNKHSFDNINQSSADLTEFDEQLAQLNSQQFKSKKREIITSNYQFIQDKNTQQQIPRSYKKHFKKNTIIQSQYPNQVDKIVLNIPHMREIHRQQTLKQSVLHNSGGGDQNFIINSLSNHSQFNNQLQHFPKSPYRLNNNNSGNFNNNNSMMHRQTLFDPYSPSVSAMKNNVQNMLQEIQGQISDFYLHFLKSLNGNQNEHLNEELDNYHFYHEMDKIQNFSYYFPEYNQIHVLKRYQLAQKKQIEKQKKLRKQQIRSKQQDIMKKQRVINSLMSEKNAIKPNKFQKITEKLIQNNDALKNLK